MAGSRFYRFGLTTAHQRWLVIAAWLAALVAGGVLAARFHENLEFPEIAPSGSESTAARELLETRFSQAAAEQDLIVFTSATATADDVAFQRGIDEALAALAGQEGISFILSPLASGAEDQISADRRTAFAVVGVNGSPNELVERAPGYTSAVESAASDTVQIYFTGNSPLNADLLEIGTSDLARAERIGLPIALLILLIAFGTLIAAGLPIGTALAGIVVTFGLLGVAGSFVGFNSTVESIVTMIGLGVGIDYVLFIVTRYREELAAGRATHDAIGHAVATAGKTVLFSGLTVLISLSAMLLISSAIFQQLAIGAMTVVAVMVVAALTLLPATLAVLGRWVNRLALPRPRRSRSDATERPGFWSGWVRQVMRRPLLWTVVAAALLLVMAAPALGMQLGFSNSPEAAADRSSGAGFAALATAFSPGELSPLQIVIDHADGPLDAADLDAVAALSAQLLADPDVSTVESLTLELDAAVGGHSPAELDAALNDPALASAVAQYLNTDRGAATSQMTVVPRERVDSPAAYDLVDRIREEYAPTIVGPTGARVVVGGLSAEIVDLSNEVKGKFPAVVTFVLALSFLLLLMVFRSLLLPLKAILMNLLSIGAAYGLVTLVFQEGYGERLLDFTSTGTIQVDLIVLTFAVLFGLSMDYEVFLLSRVKEEWERTGDTNRAVALGLERTARTITSAAAIMVAIFAAFMFTSLPEVKQIGFALAVAIFIDATLIRVVLVPATMRLLGDWNWWLPAWLDRILPKISLSESEAGASMAGPEPARPPVPASD